MALRLSSLLPLALLVQLADYSKVLKLVPTRSASRSPSRARAPAVPGTIEALVHRRATGGARAAGAGPTPRIRAVAATPPRAVDAPLRVDARSRARAAWVGAAGGSRVAAGREEHRREHREDEAHAPMVAPPAPRVTPLVVRGGRLDAQLRTRAQAAQRSAPGPSRRRRPQAPSLSPRARRGRPRPRDGVASRATTPVRWPRRRSCAPKSPPPRPRPRDSSPTRCRRAPPRCAARARGPTPALRCSRRPGRG